MEAEQFKQACDAIAADRQSGASQLARRCLEILARSARQAPAGDIPELQQMLVERQEQLAASRPSMAPVHNLLARWGFCLKSPSRELTEFRAAAAEEAERLCRVSRKAVAAIGRHGADYLGDDLTLITHSLSSTVVAVCEALKDRGVEVIASESRPLYEGLKLAEQLADWKVPVTVITDAQLGLFSDKADIALIGADSLLADGSAINKAGSWLLALAARERGIPLLVACESFKIRPDDSPPQLEEMDPAELGHPCRSGIALRNIYFEIIPAALVGGWINEDGVAQDWQAAKKMAGL